jgi:hypothetical protein
VEIRNRRFSTPGLVISAILLLAIASALGLGRVPEGLTLTEMSLMSIPGGVGAALLLIRSYQPPLSFGRGALTFFGGMCLGTALRDMIVLGLGIEFGANVATAVVMLALGGWLVYLGFQKPQKQCPGCAEKVNYAATTCKHCGSMLTEEEPSEPRQTGDALT